MKRLKGTLSVSFFKMKKILVILPNNLGDVIMATPVLEGLKAKYPQCFINFFVEDGFEAGIENNVFCDEVFKFPRKEIRNLLFTPQWERAVSSIRSFIEGIAQKKLDMVMNLCQHEYVSCIVPLMKGKTIVGRHFLKEGNHAIADPWSQYLYAIPFSRSSNRYHASDVYRRIAGVKNHRGGYSIHITPTEKAWALDFIRKKGIDIQRKIMVFQPGAAFPSKCWPSENFMVLGRLLVERGWQIIITGAPSEQKEAINIRQGIGGKCFSVAGETTFRQSIAICEDAHGCVSGDTAQMHAAAGLNVPVYALFGPTNPVETGPYGSGHWVFSAHCPERSCSKTKCATNSCMKSIAPGTILSCIEHQHPGKSAGCDVYRTETKPNGDFRLIAISENAHSYQDEVGASLAWKAFELESNKPALPASKKHISLQETARWLESVEKMIGLLEKYFKTRESASIGEFEREKQTLMHFKGIGEFWTALLNIRLNSIPLLHPLEGVKESLEACRSTCEQIKRAIDTIA